MIRIPRPYGEWDPLSSSTRPRPHPPHPTPPPAILFNGEVTQFLKLVQERGVWCMWPAASSPERVRACPSASQQAGWGITQLPPPHSPSLCSSLGRSLLVVTVWCRPVIHMGPEPDIRQKVMGGWSWKSSTLNIGWQDDLRLATGTLISSWSWFCTMASTTLFSQ